MIADPFRHQAFAMDLPLTVFLPRSAASGDVALAENFFHFMSCRIGKQGGGAFDTPREPEVDVFGALRYQGEVKNGGHWQFVANVDDDPLVFAAALSGLKRIGAAPQAAILSDMIEWARSNPPEIGDPTARPPALDELDDRFFAANDTASITARAATWIGALAGLTYVSDEEYLAIVG